MQIPTSIYMSRLRRIPLLLGTAVVLGSFLSGPSWAGSGNGIGVNAERYRSNNGEAEVVEEKWADGHADGVSWEKTAVQKGWTLEGINEELQQCRIVKVLNAQQSIASSTKESEEELSTFTQTLFSYLFPFGPAGNALLATAYISGPPNFLLALVPPDIDPSQLSVMVAFAIGGLLGDTLLHLVPGSFGVGGEEGGDAHAGDTVEFVIKSDQRNLLVGTMVMVGFVVFVIMDKCLRVAGMGKGGSGHGHSHSHSHSHSNSPSSGTGTGRDSDIKGELRKRKADTSSPNEPEEPNTKIEINPTSYLNIIADFSHNITDGLAMSAAFYASPTIGATTMIGVFFHEIPHEVGDFALLVQSGFTKWQAMGAQFVTAIGAFLGTFIGIAIQQYAASGEQTDGHGVPWNGGIWESGLTAGDLVLPFTAGTFLYVGFSAVPEILEVDEKLGRAGEVRRSLAQLVAMVAGFAIMFFVS